MNQKIIYYKDELNDEFSKAKIEPILIDENYKYFHGSLWNMASYIMQNFLSMPIKILYSKIKFRIKFIGKEKLKKYKKTGYFIYANHTQEFADTFIPSLGVFPKRNYFIVNPENISMKGLKTVVEMLGAIPVPGNKKAMINFVDKIKYEIEKKHSISIYPEAHIWPYYTKIRPFKSVSFKYPTKLNVPVFSLTNTYKDVNGKVRIVTYIDGPFLPDKDLTIKENQENLRNKVYETMCERSKNSDIEIIKYVKG